MTATFNPQAAAEQASKNYRGVTTQLGHLGLDTSVPEAVRAMAEKSVAQTREIYDRSKDALRMRSTHQSRRLKDLSIRRGGAQQRSTAKSSTPPSGM